MKAHDGKRRLLRQNDCNNRKISEEFSKTAGVIRKGRKKRWERKRSGRGKNEAEKTAAMLLRGRNLSK